MGHGNCEPTNIMLSRRGPKKGSGKPEGEGLANSTISTIGKCKRGRDFSNIELLEYSAIMYIFRCQTVGSTTRAPFAFLRKFKSFYDRTRIPVLLPRRETRNCPVQFSERRRSRANFITDVRFSSLPCTVNFRRHRETERVGNYFTPRRVVKISPRGTFSSPKGEIGDLDNGNVTNYLISSTVALTKH